VARGVSLWLDDEAHFELEEKKTTGKEEVGLRKAETPHGTIL